MERYDSKNAKEKMLFGHFLHRSKLPATNVNSVNRVASVRVLSDADPFLTIRFVL